ncbi:MAG: AI-2E family transporter [Chryseolinea sp.]
MTFDFEVETSTSGYIAGNLEQPAIVITLYFSRQIGEAVNTKIQLMKHLPITIQRSIELMGLVLIGTVIIVANTIIMPLLMSFFLSLLLMPVFRFFRKFKLPEAIAIFLPIFFLTAIIILVAWLFSSQVAILLKDIPQITQNVTRHLDNFSLWISNSFGFSATDQLKFITVQSNKLFNSAGSVLRGTAGPLTSTIVFFALLPIYIYLMMMYRNLFIKFILMWFEPKEHINVEEGMRQTEKMVKKYLVGLLIQITYITFLLGGSLLIFGIKHALLIGIIFAFLNLIPYLGALVGNVLGVLITLASSENIIDILIVLGVITFVQLLDNNILMPRVVGSQVKINPLASIVGIIVGGTMAGISGMFLAMPILSILKIAFDRSIHYKPWGMLLGDERPTKSPMEV